MLPASLLRLAAPLLRPRRPLPSSRLFTAPPFKDPDPDAVSSEALLNSLSAPPSGAGAAWKADILSRARTLAEASAARGSARGHTLLGHLYRDGLGVGVDEARAVALLRAGAEGGDTYGMVALGNALFEIAQRHPGNLRGEAGGVQAGVLDRDRAARETPAEIVRKSRKARRAAGFGDGEGRAFEESKIAENVKAYEEEREAALGWVRKAADGGNGEAILAMGVRVLEDDAREAVRLLTQAAKLHVPAAHLSLGQIYHAGRRDVPKDDKLALKHYSMAAQLGDPNAQFIVGHVYRVGDLGADVDLPACLQYVQLAAAQDHAAALHYLALMYRNGEGGLEPSLGMFRKYLFKACDGGYGEALACVADMYYKGEDGMPVDYVKALDYFERAGKAGEAEAMCSVAAMHYHGRGTEVNKVKSFQIYQDAAEAGSTNALRNIGAMYFKGDGVPKSEDMAERFFKMVESRDKVMKDDAKKRTAEGPKKFPVKPRASPHTKEEAESYRPGPKLFKKLSD